MGCVELASPSIVLKVIAKSPEYVPSYHSAGASGADVKAAVENDLLIEPGGVVCVPTGLFLEVPEGFEVQIRPRSGLAMKYQVTVLNSPGTIDSDYRGEVGVLLVNHGSSPFVVTPLMRIAQMVVAPVVRACFVTVDLLVDTERGCGGFGHTGQ